MCLALVGSVFAAVPSAFAQRLQTSLLNESDGLPSSHIRDLAQDNRGRLWILTRNGLATWDGQELEVHAQIGDPRQGGRVPTRQIAHLARDGRGELWFVTGSGPVEVLGYDGTAWHRLSSPSETAAITDLAVVTGEGSPEVVLGLECRGLLVRQGSRWQRHLLGEVGDPTRCVNALEVQGDTVVVGTDGGLCALRDHRVTCPGDPEAQEVLGQAAGYRDPVWAMALGPEAEGSLVWVLGPETVATLDLEAGTLERQASDLALEAPIRTPYAAAAKATVGVGPLGGVYLGTPDLLRFLDPEIDRFFPRPLGPTNGLAGTGITAFLRDREDNVWVGSYRGLARISSRRFVSWASDQGLLENEVTALAEWAPFRWLLGHNLGLTALSTDGAASRLELVTEEDGERLAVRVTQILPAPQEGLVDFAAAHRGIGRLDLRGWSPGDPLSEGDVTWTGAAQGLTGPVYSIQRDGDGNLWALTGERGIFRQQGNRFVPVDLSLARGQEGSLEGLHIHRIFSDRDGGIYLATNRGLLQRRGDSWWLAQAEGGAADDLSNPANRVFAVEVIPADEGDEEDEEGETDGDDEEVADAEVLVGTDAGLYRVVGNRLRRARLGGRTFDQAVSFILQDDEGQLWLGTDDGVEVWNGERLRSFTVRHGLAGRETQLGAARVGSQGRVWIGTEGGVSVYRPDLDQAASAAPLAEIRRVVVQGEEHSPDEPLELAYGEDNIVFHVAGVSLTGEESLIGRYRLEGYEQEWVGPETLTGPIRYTNLPPGKFRFHFAVGRESGSNWSETVSTAMIEVRPPLWRRLWVQLLALGLLVAAAFAVYRFYAAKRHASLHDPLTDLPNRTYFLQRLRAALDRWSRRQIKPGFAVLFLDFDRFKNVNDSLGHAFGDLLLIRVARRLEECMRSTDIVARLGGDEFTVLLQSVRGDREAGIVAERILETFREPFHLEGIELFIGVSIGIAMGSPRYRHPEEVLRDADTAMYRAKDEGGGRFAFFDPSMHERAVLLLRLETDLRRALERDELCLHYQPVVSLETGQPVGCEALLRWRHPDRGLQSPSEFLAVAEETGLIQPIGEWVLREATARLIDWRRTENLPTSFFLSLNVSPRQLVKPDLAQRIEEILSQVGFSGGGLTLEITESSLVERPESVQALLEHCSHLGVGFAIDDFGAGHSALSYLQTLPVQGLKMDRVFIEQLGENAASLEIVRSVVNLGENLGLSVIAEGVETERQAFLLREAGCRMAQGYLFSQPLPPDELLRYLELSEAV